MMNTTRWLAGSLGLCGVLLLGGCAAPGPYGDYGYGGYSQPYYGSAAVVAPAPVYIQGGYGGYYDHPGYYGRPSYYGRPGYVAQPGYAPRPGYAGGGYGGGRPGRPDQGYRPGNAPGVQPGYARPGRGGNPTPQQLAPSVHPNSSPNDRSLPIESQRILQERASGVAP